MNFSTTYQLSHQERQPTISNQGNKKKQRYTENTLHRRKIEMVNAPLLVQQFTHPVHPNSSNHLSYLLRQFENRTGQNRKEKNRRDKTEMKKTERKKTGETVHMVDISLLRKVMSSLLRDPDQTACFGRLTTRSSLAAGHLAVSQTPRNRRPVL